jgi:hypothetical protein
MNNEDRELRIQRCIDGELPEAAQQELLSELDGTPDGWKQLALAFVERQVWMQACTTLASDAECGASKPQTKNRSTTKNHSASFRWTAVAGLLVALGVGFSTGHRFGRRPSEGLLVRQTDGTSSSAEAASPSVAIADSDSSGATSPRIISGRPTRAIPVSNRPLYPASGMLELPVSDSSEQSLQIPVYERSTLPDASRVNPAMLTEEQQRRLERLGYRLDRRQQLITVPLEDGSQIVVPVETLGVRYGIQ